MLREMFRYLNDIVWKILALELFHLVCVISKCFRSHKPTDAVPYISTLRLKISIKVLANIFFK
jgi:hypothetical protein